MAKVAWFTVVALMEDWKGRPIDAAKWSTVNFDGRIVLAHPDTKPLIIQVVGEEVVVTRLEADHG